MNVKSVFSGILGIIAGIAIVIAVGILAMPIVFAGRVQPAITLNNQAIGGVRLLDVRPMLENYNHQLDQRQVEVRLGDQSRTVSWQALGVYIDIDKTLQALDNQPVWQTEVPLVLAINEEVSHEVLHQAFADVLQLPQNASLTIVGNTLQLQPSKTGEILDEEVIYKKIINNPYADHIDVQTTKITAEPAITDDEIALARTTAQALLEDGLELRYYDQTYSIPASVMQRLIEFVPQVEPQNPENMILGVKLASAGLKDYMTNKITKDINRPAVNAKFQVVDNKVEAFAVGQTGYEVNEEASINAIAAGIARGQKSVMIAVTETKPTLGEARDAETLGITTLLATGESNYVGSPKNRVHNISVGASKYQGLLIAPGEEFSFNEHLGPVDAEGGFLPELVIKSNVTIPEYGGGLCQVSTTVFRAAVYSGLEIIQRRNHSYAVSYYGTPGFDATIYPGYTDLRFRNNTPGYILIQTRTVGTKLLFDFWGTDDGRVVEVDGPHPYARQPDGAVKATLTQRVTVPGQDVVEDTFYSNYKSPKLFPKVVAENGEKVNGTSTSNEPTSTTNSTGTTGNTNQTNQKASPTPTPKAG